MNLAAVLREFDRVRQQIPDHLLQARRVATQQAERGIAGGFNEKRFRFGSRAHRVNRHLDDRSQLDGMNFEAQFAADDARHVEDVFDQLGL